MGEQDLSRWQRRETIKPGLELTAVGSGVSKGGKAQSGKFASPGWQGSCRSCPPVCHLAAWGFQNVVFPTLWLVRTANVLMPPEKQRGGPDTRGITGNSLRRAEEGGEHGRSSWAISRPGGPPGAPAVRAPLASSCSPPRSGKASSRARGPPPPTRKRTGNTNMFSRLLQIRAPSLGLRLITGMTLGNCLTCRTHP